MRNIAILAAAAMFVGGGAVAQTATPDQREAEHATHVPDAIEWQPAPPGLPQGAEIAVMRGDPGASEGTFAMRLKVPGGYYVAPHSHPTDENLTIISGSMLYGKGDSAERAQATELPQGTYIFLPADHTHYVWAGDEGFVLEIQAEAPFDLKYADPAEDPRQEKAEVPNRQ